MADNEDVHAGDFRYISEAAPFLKMRGVDRERDLKSLLVKGGFRYPADLIHAFVGGSQQHGASIPGKTSDLDVYGIYVELPVKIFGVDSESHFTGGTQDQYEKNRPGDEDYKVYTLKRWASLACKGNPTVLGFMYSPTADSLSDSVWAKLILPNKNLFCASSHGAAFLGYAKGQVARLKGDKGKGKHGQRPELEQAFGFDTKAAMHMMRMMFECEEFLQTGNITYPRPEKDVLLDIRQGKWTWEKLFREYYEAEIRIQALRTTSPLPEKVDREKVSNLLVQAYREHWNTRGVFIHRINFGLY